MKQLQPSICRIIPPRGSAPLFQSAIRYDQDGIPHDRRVPWEPGCNQAFSSDAWMAVDSPSRSVLDLIRQPLVSGNLGALTLSCMVTPGGNVEDALHGGGDDAAASRRAGHHEQVVALVIHDAVGHARSTCVCCLQWHWLRRQSVRTD